VWLALLLIEEVRTVRGTAAADSGEVETTKARMQREDGLTLRGDVLSRSAARPASATGRSTGCRAACGHPVCRHGAARARVAILECDAYA